MIRYTRRAPATLLHLHALHQCMLIVGTLALVSCSQDGTIERVMPAGADQRARAYLSLFVRGEIDSAVARVRPELRTADARVQLEGIGTVLRGRAVDSLRVIGVQVNTVPSARHVNISYELGDARGWAVANVAVRERGEEWDVEGVSAHVTAGPLRELNRFRLAGQTVLHYLWILLMTVASGVSVAAAVVVGCTRGMPKRWGWAVVALVGIGQFALNWTTGQWEVQPLKFLLLPAGFLQAGPVAPWIVSFSLPIGAIAALRRRRRWRAGLTGTPALPGASDSAEAAA